MRKFSLIEKIWSSHLLSLLLVLGQPVLRQPATWKRLIQTRELPFARGARRSCPLWVVHTSLPSVYLSRLELNSCWKHLLTKRWEMNGNSFLTAVATDLMDQRTLWKMIWQIAWTKKPDRSWWTNSVKWLISIHLSQRDNQLTQRSTRTSSVLEMCASPQWMNLSAFLLCSSITSQFPKTFYQSPLQNKHRTVCLKEPTLCNMFHLENILESSNLTIRLQLVLTLMQRKKKSMRTTWVNLTTLNNTKWLKEKAKTSCLHF